VGEDACRIDGFFYFGSGGGVCVFDAAVGGFGWECYFGGEKSIISF
jgi:hypothetical protein